MTLNRNAGFLPAFPLKTMADAGSRQRELPCGRMQVLLVEDNPVNRTLTRRLLEKLGCEVMTANDGQAASSLWQWHHFDVVFMDCVMPRVDGFEATRRLPGLGKTHNRAPVPVVALTASAMEEDEERCRRCGHGFFCCQTCQY